MCPTAHITFFFSNDPPTTALYTLSLHDALPIFPARHDHVADLDVLFEVAERRFELGHGDLLGVAHFPPAGAETAIGGAYRRHEEQRAVRIPVGVVRHGRVSVLGQRVHEAVVASELLQG